jgi:hypothetical protein
VHDHSSEVVMLDTHVVGVPQIVDQAGDLVKPLDGRVMVVEAIDSDPGMKVSEGSLTAADAAGAGAVAVDAGAVAVDAGTEDSGVVGLNEVVVVSDAAAVVVEVDKVVVDIVDVAAEEVERDH